MDERLRLAHAKKRDANEKAIVEELRARNISVIQTDVIDLIVGYHSRNYLFEVKNPDTCFLKDGITYRAGAIKESQTKIRRTYRGQYSIVTMLSEILTQIGYEQ